MIHQNILYGRDIFLTDPNKIHYSVIVGDRSILIGDVRIGPNTVIYYGTKIQADKSPIIIGEGCCIVDGNNLHNHIEIGDFVHIAHQCIIHRRKTGNYILKIGSGSLVGFGSQVHESIGIGCQIAPGVIVDQIVPDYSFVYDKKFPDGTRKTSIIPMKEQNYNRVLDMYRSFWGRKIIIEGQLHPLKWTTIDKSFNEAMEHMTRYFNPNIMKVKK